MEISKTKKEDSFAKMETSPNGIPEEIAQNRKLMASPPNIPRIIKSVMSFLA